MAGTADVPGALGSSILSLMLGGTIRPGAGVGLGGRRRRSGHRARRRRRLDNGGGAAGGSSIMGSGSGLAGAAADAAVGTSTTGAATSSGTSTGARERGAGAGSSCTVLFDAGRGGGSRLRGFDESRRCECGRCGLCRLWLLRVRGGLLRARLRHRALGEHVAARERDAALAREALDELARDDLFESCSMRSSARCRARA